MSVVESKATPGLPSTAASPDLRKRRAHGTAGVGIQCLDRSRKCSPRASSGAGGGNAKTDFVLALESLQYKGGKEERKAVDTEDGGRVADGS